MEKRRSKNGEMTQYDSCNLKLTRSENRHMPTRHDFGPPTDLFSQRNGDYLIASIDIQPFFSPPILSWKWETICTLRDLCKELDDGSQLKAENRLTHSFSRLDITVLNDYYGAHQVTTALSLSYYPQSSRTRVILWIRQSEGDTKVKP